MQPTGDFPIEGIDGSNALERLPILDKEAVRAAPLDFLADDCDPREMYAEATSGTTGAPLSLYWSAATHQSWYACFERRVRNWAGVQLGERWATLGGQLIAPINRQRPPFWVWNAPAAQLYMSSYHLRPDFLDAYLDEVVHRRIVYLFGYASALDALATHAIERGRRDVQVKVAISNAEPFYRHQRERIEQAFNCQTRDMYAPAELTVAAFECERGRMHLSPDVGITEVVDDEGRALPPGDIGELVVTSLLNTDQILVRYRQGDRGALAEPGDLCECGRTLPVLACIEGRVDDLIITPDGRKVGRLDPVFKAALRIREAQIVQDRLDRVTVRIVPAAGYGEQDELAVRRGLEDRLGAMQIEIQVVDQIERTKNGKFRAVVSQLADQVGAVA